MQMANAFSFSLRRFVVRGFSERRLCLLSICLGLLLSQGCAMLQRPSETSVPAEMTTQPAPSALAPAQPADKKSTPVQAKLPQVGEASWYGAQHQGKQTASGTTFDQARFTAAHTSLPFGSKIKVTNLGNGKTVEVEINDRRPFAENRIIDLSQAAARALGMIESGTATVRLELSSSQ
jgi:rare lipoprotein A